MPEYPEYAELHAHTNLSLLDGTSDPEDMAERGAALGLNALAVTDHDSLAGIVRFAAAAKRHNLHAIIGAELTVSPSPDPGKGGRGVRAANHHLTVLAESAAGYASLCALLTGAYHRGGKDAPHVTFDDLAARNDGLIALSGCPEGELCRAIAGRGHAAGLAVAARFRDAFGADRYYVELSRHGLQADGPRTAALRAVAKELGLGCVATNDAHYHDRSRALLHHVVTCIRHGVTLAEAGALLRGNDEYLLKSPDQMARLFRDEVRLAAEEARPELDPLRSTLAIAERCTFTLRDLRYAFPEPYVPEGESEYSFLIRLVEAGRAMFYPEPNAEVDRRLAHELAIVRQMNLAGYLLVFKEVVDWSHQHGILCSIRGSAPASALLYCLGLCPIDPIEHNLLFERFCSPERNEYPDIDLDFAHERREEVIQHVYQKYGRERAAMVCEVNTYRIKSALRDVAKVLGLSAQRAQQLADQVDWHDADPRDRLVQDDAPAREAPQPEPDGDDRIGGRLAELLLTLAKQLLHAPRHRSIHVGGMVISSQPLNGGPSGGRAIAPIEPARMPDRTILPWDKDDLTLLAEEFGVQLIKMDFLGLGMLSLIARCFEHVRQTTGRALELHGFRYDERAFDVLCDADTIGLFQVESRAQQSFLPRLRPRSLSEVAISVGAIRPGPGAARAGEHIVRRRQGREPITYPAPELADALNETYGVLLWQEQCIQVAVIAAGYTPGEGDQLRRAMSHKRSYERMEQLCADLVQRMTARGYAPDVADAVRKMVVGFAGYGFPRAHAYPFAHVALISATLRLRYPAAYYAALLNSQPMGFYAPHTVVWDAHRHGVAIRPVDVNRSDWECSLEPLSPEEAAAAVVVATGGGHEARDGHAGPDGRIARSAGAPVRGRPFRVPADPSSDAIRLGLKEVRGLGPAARETFERERARGPFRSLADFVARTGFDRDALERLAEVGAFLSLPQGGSNDQGRRSALWTTGELAGFGEGHLPGLAEQLAERAGLPEMTEWEEVQADYRGVGYSLGRHVVAYFRPRLDRARALRAEALPGVRPGRIVRIGGLVIVRQRPETASDLVFLTLEDETGLMNAVVRPAIYERYRRVLRGEPLVLLEGRLQSQDGVLHVLVQRAAPLVQAPPVAVPSHDFH